MTVRLSTTVKNVNRLVTNPENAKLILKFFEFMKKSGTSTNYQNNNLKVIIAYSIFIGPSISLLEIKTKVQVVSFLDTKIKTYETDPDKRWITTWNDYLGRIKFFYRWLHNTKCGDLDEIDLSDWETPDFVRIKKKKTKRISPYLESELWEKDDLLNIIKYEPHRRNKAVLSLLWDLNARPHEITLLKIKHIRLKEKYGEGEIPHEAKTGTGPILLTLSFPYVRDWLNDHPFGNEADSRLICNLNNGSPVTPDGINKVMKQLRERIITLLETGEITKVEEKERLEFLIKTKKWNPYCIRHSAITSDSDYLPEYALKKKVRWSMNSKQGARYIKRRMGNELKQKILEHNGLVSPQDLERKPSILNCPRCNLINVLENKYCSKCSYPLSQSSFQEIKKDESMNWKMLEQKNQNDLNLLRDEMNTRLAEIISLIQHNQKFTKVKPEALMEKKLNPTRPP